MNLMELVHPSSEQRGSRSTTLRRSSNRFSEELVGPVRSAIVRARQFLFAERRSDGRWVRRETASPSLTSLLISWLAYSDDEKSELAQQCAATLCELQLAEGGWAGVCGGAVDVSASVQCYLALKLVGIDPSSERLARARKVIRQVGGADAADATTRYLLALFGQVGYDICPVAPERRNWSTIRSRRPARSVEIDRGVRELFLRSPREWPRLTNSAWLGPICRQIDRMPFDELFWHAVVLKAEGKSDDNGQLQACERRMRELVSVDEDTNRAWPRYGSSPLSDTALVARSLMASGMSPDRVALAGTVDHVCELCKTNDTAVVGAIELSDAINLCNGLDWNPDKVDALPPPIGVCDERPSGFFNIGGAPITQLPFSESVDALIERLLQRQRSDGGWGSVASSLTEAECSDVVATGAALDAVRVNDSWEVKTATERGVNYLRATQCADGGWRRNFDADDVMATSAAVCGMLASGIRTDDDGVAAAVNWLVVHQELDGGWSEADGDEALEPRSGVSPTARAILALAAAGMAHHRATRRGVELLVDSQGEDGSWSGFELPPHDAAASGRPRGHLHSVAWPLLALSHWSVAAGSAQPSGTREVSLKLIGVSAAD